MIPFPRTFLEDDLIKPIFGALWVGLVMSAFDGVPKRSKVWLFMFLLLLLTVWLTHKRNREETED